MGQRLNIEIIQNGETLANAYYHWSAYTSSSLELTNMILKKVQEIHHENPVIRAIRLLEETGACLTEDEVELIHKTAPLEKFDIATSRNGGLIAISEKGMNETRQWEEGRVEIVLDNEIVNFIVLSSYPKDEYLEFYEETEESFQEMPVFSTNNENIPFAEFDVFATTIIDLIKNGVYAVRSEDEDILAFIE